MSCNQNDTDRRWGAFRQQAENGPGLTGRFSEPPSMQSDVVEDDGLAYMRARSAFRGFVLGCAVGVVLGTCVPLVVGAWDGAMVIFNGR